MEGEQAFLHDHLTTRKKPLRQTRTQKRLDVAALEKPPAPVPYIASCSWYRAKTGSIIRRKRQSVAYRIAPSPRGMLAALWSQPELRSPLEPPSKMFRPALMHIRLSRNYSHKYFLALHHYVPMI